MAQQFAIDLAQQERLTSLPKRALFDAQPVVHHAFAKNVERKLAQPITATEAHQVGRRTGPLDKVARFPLFAALRRNPFQAKQSEPVASTPATHRQTTIRASSGEAKKRR